MIPLTMRFQADLSADVRDEIQFAILTLVLPEGSLPTSGRMVLTRLCSSVMFQPHDDSERRSAISRAAKSHGPLMMAWTSGTAAGGVECRPLGSTTVLVGFGRPVVFFKAVTIDCSRVDVPESAGAV